MRGFERARLQIFPKTLPASTGKSKADLSQEELAALEEKEFLSGPMNVLTMVNNLSFIHPHDQYPL
jgi:hypothetical protein